MTSYAFRDGGPIPDDAEIIQQGNEWLAAHPNWDGFLEVVETPNGRSSERALSSEPSFAPDTSNGHQRPSRRTSWTAEDLLTTTFDDPRWAVEGIMPEGLVLFAGAPKLGKSWMALGLSIAVASGGRALGMIPVESGEVLYLALEDSPRRLQGRLRALLGDSSTPKGLHLFTEWPRLREGCEEQMGSWLTEHPGARLVVVDVYTRIRPRDVKRSDLYVADYDAAADLQSVATEHGIAILAVYHTRKAESDDFVETVSGTFGTAAAADTIWVARRGRGEADATLKITGRDVNEQDLALRFASEVGTWSLIGDAAEYAMGETRRQILDILRSHGALSPKQIADLSDIGHELAKKTCQRMFSDGQVEASGGRYSPLESPVPAVPLSPDEPLELGDGGQGDGGDTDIDTLCEVCGVPCSFEDEQGRCIHVGCVFPGAVSVSAVVS